VNRELGFQFSVRRGTVSCATVRIQYSIHSIIRSFRAEHAEFPGAPFRSRHDGARGEKSEEEPSAVVHG